MLPRSLSLTLMALGGIAVGAAGMYTLGRSAEAHAAVTTHGEWVKIAAASGDSMRAYVAYPERKDKAPAIIVIHEIFGLSEWEPTVADKLAGQGYVAIVPDLLSPRFGPTPADGDSGRKLTAQLDPEAVNQDLDAAFRYLNTLPAVRTGEIATIGFCWGGSKSFRYATHNPALKAAVICYGSAPDSAQIAQINAPLLGVYGESDARITAALPETERLLTGAGVRYSDHVYAGTGHGFLRPGRKGSDGPAVDQAWGDILRFYSGVFGK